jgi:D,D-heptose 1,7-bisphosphate phosphatase
MTNALNATSLPAVIIAGGKGTRLGLPDLPKPMAPLLGKPLLQYQIELLAASGIQDITILAGHLAEKITGYFGDGQRFGVHLRYIIEDVPLGTAGAVRQLAGVLKNDFLVLYGDVYVDMDLAALVAWHRREASLGSLVVHPNDHPHDSDLVAADAEGRISAFISKPHPAGRDYRNLVNAALYVLSPGIFDFIPADRPSDFGKDVFPAVLAGGGRLRAYATPEYLKDMGTPERLTSVGQAISSGKTARRNLKNRQKAIFLDRDGVINVDNPAGVLKAADFRLLPGVAEAIRRINKSEYLCIVVTNQPFIAKGQMSPADLEAVHARMDSLLGEAGAFVDATYFCPHHPEKGWPGEVPELKIACDCRKPAPGMLKEAAQDLNIDLAASWIIGDRLSDLAAGQAAGCRDSILVGHTETACPAGVSYFADAVLAIANILENHP